MIIVFLSLNTALKCVDSVAYFSDKLFSFTEKVLFFYLSNTPVNLFILGVSSIIGGSDREEHDITSCGLLEGQGDGDASTLTGQVRLHAKNYGRVRRSEQLL